MKCSCPKLTNDRGEVVHYVDQLCQVHRYEDPKDVRIRELEKQLEEMRRNEAN